MSGGAFQYQQYHIDEIADRIEEEIANQSKPEPAMQMVHYVSIYKIKGEGCKEYIYNHPRFSDRAEAERWLETAYFAYKVNGKIYDHCDTWIDSTGMRHRCEYQISESDHEEYADDFDEDEFYGGERFSDETIAKFKNAVRILRQAAVYAQRIDWLLSGDDGESSFHERLKDELEELKKNFE